MYFSSFTRFGQRFVVIVAVCICFLHRPVTHPSSITFCHANVSSLLFYTCLKISFTNNVHTVLSLSSKLIKDFFSGVIQNIYADKWFTVAISISLLKRNIIKFHCKHQWLSSLCFVCFIANIYVIFFKYWVV